MKDLDDEIEEYRRRLLAEAELTESDLDELEDHLRELTHDLRSAGMPAAEAVTEAARRLGDPRQLAREHARVRSPFGTPLATGRALSAAVIFCLPLITWISNLDALRAASLRIWFEFGAFAIVAIALAARMTWARAAVLGLSVQGLTLSLVSPVPVAWPHLIAELGLLAFVMPWSRKEVSPAAAGLALQVWAYGSASSVLGFLAIAPESEVPISSVCGSIAVVCAATSCIGTVMRSRWSPVASAICALMLLLTLGGLSMSWTFVADAAPSWLYIFCAVGSGALAAAVAGFLGWRTMRSHVETSQYALR